MTGLRPGELLGLRWEDVDLDAGVIRVRVELTREPAGGVMVFMLSDLKTDKSKRTIRMPASVVQVPNALRKDEAAAVSVTVPGMDRGSITAQTA